MCLLLFYYFIEEDGFMFPSDSRYITYSDLNGMTKDEVALLRNEIYARHGYIFQSEAYSSYFENMSWYYPNPDFDESLFNSIEKKNKETIVAFETDMGWR